MDPCSKQASGPRNSPCPLFLCLDQHGWRHHGLRHPVHHSNVMKQIRQLFYITTNVEIIHTKWTLVYPFESVNVSCFMSSCQTAFIAFSISSNVFFVPESQLFNCFLDDGIASFISHGFGTETLDWTPSISSSLMKPTGTNMQISTWKK